MQRDQYFNFLLNLLFSFLKLFTFSLVLMGLARLYLLLTYGNVLSYNLNELFLSFLLGTRLDASILAYIFIIPVLLLFVISILNIQVLAKYLYTSFKYYFFLLFSLLFLMIFIDFTYFSFFASHSTLMIFGVIDDDTSALINTALANYNIALVMFFILTGLVILYFIVSRILKEKKILFVNWGFIKKFIFFLILIASISLMARGSVGMFPLSHYTPDPTSNHFLNELSKSAHFSLIESYKSYSKSKSGQYNLISKLGYSGNISDAFKKHIQNKEINTTNLLNNIHYMTKKNTLLKEKPPHVVVVMVESFGMPILKYQSEEFNILGKLKKHFQSDIVFTKFISSSNGTLVSLEPLLLNITARPNSTAFAQGTFLNTEFIQASARVYEEVGYETSFVYGGDLSWRNIGNFMLKQGFMNVEGKTSITKKLNNGLETTSHDWGVFDEYLYQYVEQKLATATSPQFIFVLTTNNHPPYTIPENYKSKSLEFSKDLRKHISGDINLAKKRFFDYAYALDTAGGFLDTIKEGNLKDNTVIVITADNNTVEGIMKYDDYYTETKKIPFYIYLPESLKPAKKINTKVASSHKDVFPTLYNLTLSEARYISIGTDLLDENILHCGFNDAGVIMSQDGGFQNTKAITNEQRKCEEYYRATLAVTEYLIQSQK